MYHAHAYPASFASNLFLSYPVFMDTAQREIEMMRAFIHRKRKERKEKLLKMLARAREDFNRIIKMIVEDYRPEKIYQWGSLVDGQSFQEISDIDIAVEGVHDPESFLRLYARAKELTSFPLHIVQLEDLHPDYSRNIREKGKLVYERPV